MFTLRQWKHKVLTIFCRNLCTIAKSQLAAQKKRRELSRRFPFNLEGVSCRPRKVAQDVVQNATVFDVFDFDSSIDPTLQGNVFG